MWKPFSARLKRLLKNSISARFVSGHDFSRADKLFVFVIPSGLQPARDSAFPTFSAACEAAPLQDKDVNRGRLCHNFTVVCDSGRKRAGTSPE